MKLKEFVSVKKVPVVTGVVSVGSALAPLSVLAASGSSITTPTDWQSVIDAITAQVSVSTIVGVLASVTAVCIGMVFMWWGLRKVVRMIMGAFRRGKMSV